jgi:hypothetical protein
MDLGLTARNGRHAALVSIAIGLALAACRAFPLPSPPDPAQAVLDGCRKVLLPAVDATTFDPNAPGCVIVLWDMTMEGVVLEPKPPLDRATRTLPLDLQATARAAGYEDSCGFETNYREGWLKHLPPVDTTLPERGGWIATIWTRGAVRDQARALCDLIES